MRIYRHHRHHPINGWGHTFGVRIGRVHVELFVKRRRYVLSLEIR